MDSLTIYQYLLNKQSLIEKKPISEISSIVSEQLGLHSTDYLTPYISLWNRIEDFDPAVFFEAMNKLEFLRKRAYRGTVFVIEKRLFPTINALSKIFAESWIKGFERELGKTKIDFEELTGDIITLFREHDILTLREFKKFMTNNNEIPAKWYGLLLRYFELVGILVRTKHRYIDDKVIQYELVENVFPKIFNKPMEIGEAREEIFIRYVKQFGPISIEDFSWWLPTTKTNCNELLEHFENKIEKILINDQELYMHAEDYEKLQKFEPLENNIIRFIPYEDHFPKAYIQREWFMPQEIEQKVMGQQVITRGQIFPTIWLNNTIIGKWEIEYKNKKKTIAEIKISELFNKKSLSESDLKKINSQKEQLEIFLNDKLLTLKK